MTSSSRVTSLLGHDLAGWQAMGDGGAGTPGGSGAWCCLWRCACGPKAPAGSGAEDIGEDTDMQSLRADSPKMRSKKGGASTRFRMPRAATGSVDEISAPKRRL